MTEQMSHEERARYIEIEVQVIEDEGGGHRELYNFLIEQLRQVENAAYERVAIVMCDACRGERKSHRSEPFWDERIMEYWHKWTSDKYPPYKCRATKIRALKRKEENDASQRD